MPDLAYTPRYPHTIVPGIVLRPILPRDGMKLWGVISQWRTQLQQYDPYFTSAASRSLEAVHANLQRSQEHADLGADFSVGLWTTRSPSIVGRISCRLDPDVHYLRFGYWIIPTYQNRGLMTASIRYLLSEVFRRQSVVLAWLTCHHHNLPSIRVAEKTGFSRATDKPQGLSRVTVQPNQHLYLYRRP